MKIGQRQLNDLDSNLIKGGFHSAQSLEDRNSIPENLRTEGMIVSVSNILSPDGIVYYKLLSGPWLYDDSDWEYLNIGGDTTNVHNSLAGLNIGDYIHLTAAEYSLLLNSDEKNAITNANSPSAANPFLTLDDLPSGDGGTPGGVDTYVQFNDSGAFGGSDGLVFDKTNKALTVKSSISDGSLDAFIIKNSLDDLSLNVKDDGTIIINNRTATGTTTTSTKSVFNINDKNGSNLFDLKENGSIRIGYNSGNGVDSGDLIAIGWDAASHLQNVLQGHNSVFIGAHSGNAVTTGKNFVLIGEFAGANHVTSQDNISIGINAGEGTGAVSSFNVNIGTFAYKVGTGSQNINIGYQSGLKSTSVNGNTCVGNATGGWTNTNTGDFNSCFGFNAGMDFTTATGNGLFGREAGGNLTSGSYNLMAGYQPGFNCLTGDRNVFLGYQAGYNETGSDKLYISHSSTDALIYGNFATEQVGINTITPNAVAALDVSSTTKGFMPPRMTAAQASAIAPANGLMLYVTDTNVTFTAIGFWGYENGAWVKL